jgi:hypothetical protein
VLDVRWENGCGIYGEHHPGPPSKPTRHQRESTNNFARAREKYDPTRFRHPIGHNRQECVGRLYVEVTRNEIENRHYPAHPKPDLIVAQNAYSSSFDFFVIAGDEWFQEFDAYQGTRPMHSRMRFGLA